MSKRDESGRSRPRVPKHLTDHFEDALDAHERLNQVIRLSTVGITRTTAMPRITRAIVAVADDGDGEQRISRADTEARLAQIEIDAGFPHLHSFAVIAMWSWLENLVKDLLIRLLMHEKECLNHNAFQKITIKLGEFLKLTRSEQIAYLVEMLERDTSAALKLGVNRFEALLDPVGLSGSVPKDVSEAIFELQQVRNVIAHRNGRCDRRLRAHCPKLKAKLGEPIKISAKQLATYRDAVGG